MRTPKLGKWIKADRVRVVSVDGKKVLEVQRVVPKRKNLSRRKSKKEARKSFDMWMGAGSDAAATRAEKRYRKTHVQTYKRPIKRRK